MKKRILLVAIAIVAVAFGVVGMSAFEAHVINVTATIENALAVNTYGIDFGTVFPQEYLADKTFNIGLSQSFIGSDRDHVNYKIVQKDKPWTLNFGGGDVSTHNRSLLCVDPDTDNLLARCNIASNVLTIITDNNKGAEDLFGPGETALGTDWTAPRMVIPMGGNFTIETKVAANPTGYDATAGHYQSGGILVYESNGNVVRLELTKWGAGTTGNNSIYMESQENGVKVGKAYTINDIDFDEVYLKLTRTGNLFKGYYKEAVGDVWTEVPTQEGLTDFTNQNILIQPKVGLAATDNQGGLSFSAAFDYVTFNGDYQSLCKFLSKTPVTPESGDAAEPSYYINGEPINSPEGDSCQTVTTQALGLLTKQDISDVWTVDLKVPPVAGYVGQDWPASCANYVVEENNMDYGCDLWVEVTGIDTQN